MTKAADLIAYVFDEQLRQRSEAAQLSVELMQWMETSSRYTDFVDTYRDKIRKKIRVTRDAESVLDVRGELEVAYSLLNDRRLAVTYEPYASAKRRGPDFSVTFRANLVFNVEVARIRVEESEVEGHKLASEAERARKEERILRILLDKLGQMQPGMANLLVIYTRQELVRSIELGPLMQRIKTRAEGKDATLYANSRYSSPAAFYKDFLHLSAILLWAPGQANQLWANKQARPGLAEKALRQVELVFQARSLPPGAGAARVDENPVP